MFYKDLILHKPNRTYLILARGIEPLSFGLKSLFHFKGMPSENAFQTAFPLFRIRRRQVSATKFHRFARHFQAGRY